ncbi:MAG TPA: hypothetical protein PLF01_06625 [Alphaproteobacteria bacterium]|nr:hypothetical protein [Alphaproteobacteria bacterium]
MPLPTLHLVDNTSLKGREDKYEIVEVDLEAVLESWKISLFSFEWLTPDGAIRSPEKLPETEREKYHAVLRAYEAGEPLERPVLGIGIMDNVEIGSRRDVLLSLMTTGLERLSVHIPKSNAKDFAPFM